MLKIYSFDGNNTLSEQRLESMFPFLCEGKHIISLVGGGGKTTIMYEMARFCADKGMRTLVTTTTRIYEPENGLFAESETLVKQLWAEGKPAVVGERTNDGKLKMLSVQELYSYIEMADMVLIEADGAKGKPCKAPREKEPVLLPECDIILGVMGLDVPGRPLEEVCFCLDETKDLLGVSSEGHQMTTSDMAEILLSERGTRKGVGQRAFYPVLNKCDVPGGMEQGFEILMELKEKGVLTACMTCRC